jgi:NitT/TauT family transport system ATP-binding protein
VTHDIDEALVLADRIVVLSSRPAQIKKIFDVPFARDHRDSIDSVLGHPSFVPLRHEIRELLRPDLAAEGVAEAQA